MSILVNHSTSHSVDLDLILERLKTHAIVYLEAETADPDVQKAKAGESYKPQNVTLRFYEYCKDMKDGGNVPPEISYALNLNSFPFDDWNAATENAIQEVRRNLND